MRLYPTAQECPDCLESPRQSPVALAVTDKKICPNCAIGLTPLDCSACQALCAHQTVGSGPRTVAEAPTKRKPKKKSRKRKPRKVVVKPEPIVDRNLFSGFTTLGWYTPYIGAGWSGGPSPVAALPSSASNPAPAVAAKENPVVNFEETAAPAGTSSDTTRVLDGTVEDLQTQPSLEGETTQSPKTKHTLYHEEEKVRKTSSKPSSLGPDGLRAQLHAELFERHARMMGSKAEADEHGVTPVASEFKSETVSQRTASAVPAAGTRHSTGFQATLKPTPNDGPATTWHAQFQQELIRKAEELAHRRKAARPADGRTNGTESESETVEAMPQYDAEQERQVRTARHKLGAQRDADQRRPVTQEARLAREHAEADDAAAEVRRALEAAREARQQREADAANRQRAEEALEAALEAKRQREADAVKQQRVEEAAKALEATLEAKRQREAEAVKQQRAEEVAKEAGKALEVDHQRELDKARKALEAQNRPNEDNPIYVPEKIEDQLPMVQQQDPVDEPVELRKANEQPSLPPRPSSLEAEVNAAGFGEFLKEYERQSRQDPELEVAQVCKAAEQLMKGDLSDISEDALVNQIVQAHIASVEPARCVDSINKKMVEAISQAAPGEERARMLERHDALRRRLYQFSVILDRYLYVASVEEALRKYELSEEHLASIGQSTILHAFCKSASLEDYEKGVKALRRVTPGVRHVQLTRNLDKGVKYAGTLAAYLIKDCLEHDKLFYHGQLGTQPRVTAGFVKKYGSEGIAFELVNGRVNFTDTLTASMEAADMQLARLDQNSPQASNDVAHYFTRDSESDPQLPDVYQLDNTLGYRPLIRISQDGWLLEQYHARGMLSKDQSLLAIFDWGRWRVFNLQTQKEVDHQGLAAMVADKATTIYYTRVPCADINLVTLFPYVSDYAP